MFMGLPVKVIDAMIQLAASTYIHTMVKKLQHVHLKHQLMIFTHRRNSIITVIFVGI